MNIKLVNKAVRLQIGYDYEARLRSANLMAKAERIQKLLDVMTTEERNEYERRIV